MKKIFWYYLFMAVFAFASCDKSDDPSEAFKPRKGDVYVAGYEYKAGIGSVAKLWKNGADLNLSSGTEANSVFVTGGDVYVAGYTLRSIGTNKNFATVWKNGIAEYLSKDTRNGWATSVFVTGDDVYVAGYEREYINGELYECGVVWKNGEAQYLSEGDHSIAYSVFVYNGDVYVSGMSGAIDPRAVLWKNGTPQYLSDYAYSGGEWCPTSAVSVFVSNGDVYVAGTEHCSSLHTAKLWKNGEEQLLSEAVMRNSNARSVYVSGGNVYVAGTLYVNDEPRAVLWINGAQQFINVSFEVSSSFANSVFVSDKDVYVAGTEYSMLPTSYFAISKFWKNSVAQDLSTTYKIGDSQVHAVSIFVVE